ncbi:MAG: type II toxin-antitoxin system death-on-curing family toxin [Reyranellaceae bacterium]
MTEPIWLSDREVVAINARALSLFGGLTGGVQNEMLFQAALARPLNKWHYEEPRPDIFELAAAYAFALCKGHVFHDGNKRTAHAVAAIFLDMNGWTHEAREADVVRTMIGVAEGSIKETALARWFQKTSRRNAPP